MQQESLVGLVELEAVHELIVLAQHPQRGDDKGLGLTAGEQRRSVHPREHVHFAGKGTDLVGGASVGAHFVARGDRAHRALDEALDDAGDVDFGVGVSVGKMLDSTGGQLGDRCSALFLAVDHDGFGGVGGKVAVHPRVDVVELLRCGQNGFGLADLVAHDQLEGNDLFDLFLSDGERLDEHVLGNFLRAGFDHRDAAGMSGDSEIERALGHLLFGGIDDERAVQAAHAHGADRAVPGDVGDGQGH